MHSNFLKKRLPGLLGGIVLCTAFGISWMVHASEPITPFYNPSAYLYQVTDDGSVKSSIDALVDSLGNTHLVYVADGIVWYKQGLGIAQQISAGANPAIDVSDAGVPFVVFEDGGMVVLATLNLGGNRVTTPIDATGWNPPDVAVASDNSVHIVYQKDGDGDGYSEIYYINNSVGLFTGEIMIADSRWNGGGMFNLSEYYREPAIVVDDAGNYHIVYRHEYNNPAPAPAYMRDFVGYYANNYIFPGAPITSDSPEYAPDSFSISRHGVTLDQGGIVHVVFSTRYNTIEAGVFSDQGDLAGGMNSISHGNGIVGVAYTNGGIIEYKDEGNNTMISTTAYTLTGGTYPRVALGRDTAYVYFIGADNEIRVYSTQPGDTTPPTIESTGMVMAGLTGAVIQNVMVSDDIAVDETSVVVYYGTGTTTGELMAQMSGSLAGELTGGGTWFINGYGELIGLQPETVYYFFVYAEDGAGNSVESGVESFFTEADQLALAFDAIAAQIEDEGFDSNLDQVTMFNVTAFPDLYFEAYLSGVFLGGIAFQEPVNLFDTGTQLFLEDLANKFLMSQGNDLSFLADNSEFEERGAIVTIAIDDDFLSYLTGEYGEEIPLTEISIKNSSGDILDPATMLTGFSCFYDDVIELPICEFQTAHFTTFDLDPHLIQVNIQSNNSQDANDVMVGETVTVSFVGSEPLTGVVATIYGRPATVTLDPSGLEGTATITVQTGDTLGIATFTIDFVDYGGNAGDTVSAITHGGNVIRIPYTYNFALSAVGATSIRATYLTDFAATGQIYYQQGDGSLPYDGPIAGEGGVTSHDILLTGLIAGSLYTLQAQPWYMAIGYGYKQGQVSSPLSLTLPRQATLGGGDESYTGSTALDAGDVASGEQLPLNETNITLYSDPTSDDLTGSLQISGGTILVVAGDWDSILNPPSDVSGAEEASEEEIADALGDDVGSSVIALTFSAGAEGASLASSGTLFTLRIFVPGYDVGTVFSIVRSSDGTTWELNTPDSTCTLDADQYCTFQTDHLSFFAPFLDASPEPFSFTTKTSAELSTSYTSNAITVTGIATEVTASINAGTFSVNGGAAKTSATVNNGDSITITRTSSSSYSTSIITTLTVGDQSGTYTITTKARSNSGAGGGGGGRTPTPTPTTTVTTGTTTTGATTGVQITPVSNSAGTGTSSSAQEDTDAQAQDFAQEVAQAVSFLYTNGMTKYETVDEFMGEATMTREQIAKFAVVFIKEVLGKTGNVQTYTTPYSDEDQIDPTLLPYVIEAYELGVMHGYDGKFMPTEPVSKAQLITILIRALKGLQDETSEPRYASYYNLAVGLGITKDTLHNMDRLLPRQEGAVIMRRARSLTK